MTIYELAQGMIENDHTGDYYDRDITLEEASDFISWMDPDTELPEDLTPEALMDAWNDIVRESNDRAAAAGY